MLSLDILSSLRTKYVCNICLDLVFFQISQYQIMIGILFYFASKLLTKEFIVIEAKGIPFLLIQPCPVIFILESCIFPMD